MGQTLLLPDAAKDDTLPKRSSDVDLPHAFSLPAVSGIAPGAKI